MKLPFQSHEERSYRQQQTENHVHEFRRRAKVCLLYAFYLIFVLTMVKKYYSVYQR